MKNITDLINEAKASTKFGNSIKDIAQTIASHLSQLDDTRVNYDDYASELMQSIEDACKELNAKGYNINIEKFFGSFGY